MNEKNWPNLSNLGLNDIMEIILADDRLHDRIALVHAVDGMKRPTALAIHFARAVEVHVREKVWNELAS
jgi:hypothetical protein